MFMLPDNPGGVRVRKQDFTGSDAKAVSTLLVSAGVTEGKPVRVYVGPKQRDWLSKADPQLEAVVDYGYFGFIAPPLVFCLLWIHNYVGNFGWSIIFLTLCPNLLLFPLPLIHHVSFLT